MFSCPGPKEPTHRVRSFLSMTGYPLCSSLVSLSSPFISPCSVSPYFLPPHTPRWWPQQLSISVMFSSLMNKVHTQRPPTGCREGCWAPHVRVCTQFSQRPSAMAAVFTPVHRSGGWGLHQEEKRPPSPQQNKHSDRGFVTPGRWKASWWGQLASVSTLLLGL